MKLDNIKKAYFRVDANHQVGLGHLSRCISLAKSLKVLCKDINITFISDIHPDFRLDMLQSNFNLFKIKSLNMLEDAWATKNKIGEVIDESIIILDSYRLGFEWEKYIKETGAYLIVIDDFPSRSHYCDVILDQTLERDGEEYFKICERVDKVVSGSEFSLMDISYSDLRLQAHVVGDIRKILVNFGGTDMRQLVPKVAKVFSKSQFEKFGVTFVSGRGEGALDCVKECLSDSLNKRFSVIEFCENLGELMLEHDLIIGAGGISSYERCCLKKPSLVYQIADNQSDNINRLNKKEAILFLGNYNDFRENVLIESLLEISSNKLKIEKMSQAASEISDGRGAYRFVSEIFGEKTKSGQSIRISVMTYKEKELVFKLQCKNNVRIYFNNPSVPTWDEHSAWFDRTIIKNDCFLYSIIVESQFVGYLRLDLKIIDKTALVSIIVDPEFQGQGIATGALINCSLIHPEFDLFAEIKDENIASIKSFSKAGFVYNSFHEKFFLKRKGFQ